MTSKTRMEDSELWRVVGLIEAGQSITDVDLVPYFDAIYVA